MSRPTNHADAMTDAAHRLRAAGRHQEACAMLEQAVTLFPDDVEPCLALARLRLNEHDLKAALALYRGLSDRFPYDLHVAALRRDLGLALYARHYWEEALPLLEVATRAEPWDFRMAAARDRIRRPCYVAPDVVDSQTGQRLLRYAPREGTTYMFIIDVVGTCNLRCPTCPVGNSAGQPRERGFMGVELFERILAKIVKESPVSDPSIVLFNWGEPLLHPQLPDILRRIRAHGLRSYLSSNLNIKRGLDDVMAANPDDFKISLSGFSPASYGRTHVRGSFALLRANMLELKRLREVHGATTNIWVGHHIYRSNQHEIEEVRALCATLGFGYHPIPAFYMPLERVSEILDGTAPPQQHAILAELITHPAERSARAALNRSGRYDCELRFNQTVINHDGSVALCCSVYDPTSMLGVPFLDRPLGEIERLKYQHPFCNTCFSKNLQYVPSEVDPGHGIAAIDGPPS